MSQKKWTIGAVLSAILIVTAVVAGLLASANDSEATGNGDVTTSFIIAGKGCDTAALATQAMKNRGFNDGEFIVGDANIDWSAPEAQERGDGAFMAETPTSAQMVIDQLNSGSSEAEAAKQGLLNQSGVTPEQLNDPANWVPVQYTVDVTLDGNTAYQNGTMVEVGTRNSQSGEVIWALVHPDKCTQADNGVIPPEDAITAHRAGCGNPQTELPRPSVPTITPPGSTPTTKPPHGSTTTTTPGRKSNVPTTVAPSTSTIVPPGYVPPPSPPPTAAPDPTPPGVVIIDQTPPPVTHTDNGNTGVTLPPLPEPPAQPPTPAPPGGGTTPRR